jgi:hypothetical protein
LDRQCHPRALRRAAPRRLLVECTVSKSVFPDETPNFTERLSASTAAKKAQLERAKRIAKDPNAPSD